ncbi:MAG TPA: outer membrane lipoprotein-sorting protein [Acidobacteriota bacterium]|nr:outer membrane lipoprotein-sorting protein [Acidobacteriota bacterium]
MKKVMTLGVLVFVLIAVTPLAWADDAAEALMNESHQAYYYAADGGSARVTMVLTDKKGRTRNREFWMLRRDVEDMGDQRYYTYFIKPADISRTAFLVHKNAAGNDDRWLYMPSLDLVKRIAADDRRTSFVGSDFTYEDVSGRLPILDTHEIIGADTALGRSATKVKSTPKDPKTADYAYRVTWVDDATKLSLREEYYDKNDVEVRLFEVGKIETIDGIPTAVERTMSDLKGNHSTTISFAEISYAAPLDADEFNERLLRNAPSAYTR